MVSGASQKAIVIAIAALSACCALAILLFGTGQDAHNIIQLLTFPLMVALLSKLSLQGTRIPRVVVGMATVGVLCGALVRNSEKWRFWNHPFYVGSAEHKDSHF
jgi:hypothetical protein